MNRSFVAKLLVLPLFGNFLLVSCHQTEAPTSSITSSKEALLKSGSGIIAPGVEGWWPGDGNTADIIGRNDGTLQNGTTFASGQVDQAFGFDGADDFVSVPGTFGGGAEATIDAWIKTTGTTSSFQAIVHAPQGEFVHLQLMAPEGGGQAIYTDAGFFVLPAIPQTPTDVFRHLAMSLKSGDSRLYIDGSLVGSSSASFSFINPTSSLRIGASSTGSRPFKGLIDEIEIYDRALTSDEIEAIFKAGKKGHKPTKLLTICHMPGTSAQKAKVIPYHALSGHLGHDDTIGPCN